MPIVLDRLTGMPSLVGTILVKRLKRKVTWLLSEWRGHPSGDEAVKVIDMKLATAHRIAILRLHQLRMLYRLASYLEPTQ